MRWFGSSKYSEVKTKPNLFEVNTVLTKIIMPSGGQTTNESVLVKWYKNVGDTVQKGDVLFEIETDKATLPIESYGGGILLVRYYQEGDVVATGEVVGYVGDEGEVPPENTKQTPIQGKDDDQPILKRESEIEKKISESEEGNGRVLASPAARYVAKKEKVNIEEVANSLFKKVIKREDVLNYLQKSETSDMEEIYFIETSPMRKTIAKRMTESVTKVPHFMVSIEIDMTQCISLRRKLNDFLKDDEIKVSFNDILMKCASKAIEKYPFINARYGEEKITIYKNVHFGLAVSVEGGLVVPVVRQTNKKTILEIARENMNNIHKARNNQLQPADLTGGTITLSNLGMFGIDCFTAIINQPESCILAVGQIAEKPVSRDGQITSRQMMTITASFDHRLIDGAVGASFLKEMKLLLENPELLLV